MNNWTKVGIVAAGIAGLTWLSPIKTVQNDPYTRTDDPTVERSSGDYDCSDFSTHREAQDFFEENGGPDDDYYNLDRDGDGEACETLP
jgi:hypothetical protein